MINFFKRIIFLKFEFEKPKKVDIILLDDNYANLKFEKSIKTKIKKRNVINSYIFIKAFFSLISFKKNNLRDIYFKKYIEAYDPIIAIGHEYNGNIFRFKKLFPQKKSIAYQLADQADFFSETSKKMIKKNLNFDLISDYFLVKNEYSKNFYSFIKSEFIIAGSVKNNEIEIEKQNKKFDIMFISQFRSKIESYFGTNNNIGKMRSIDSSTSYVLKILKNISKTYNKSIVVALTSSRRDKKYKIDSNFKRNEIQFFKRDLGEFNYEDIDATALAEKSKIIVTINSTLGFELLSRGMKVLFLDIHHYLGGSPLENIVDSKSGFYWYKGENKKEIEEKILNLFKITNDDWKKNCLNNSPIKFDPKNSMLKKLVKNLIQAN